MLIGFTFLFIMKIVSVLLTLLMLLVTIKADLSKYYNDEDYESQDYDYYEQDNYQSEDKSNTEAAGNPRSLSNERKSQGSTFTPSGGVDFSGCTKDPDSDMCCVMKEEEITTLEKDPILECTHKNTEQCHYTYVTQFKPSKEEICEESFDKKCSITFVKQARNETIEKCYTPLVKVCGQAGGRRRRRRYKKDARDGGRKTCQTYYETSCTTRYVEKTPGKFVAETACEKLPVELCGEGCTVKEGAEECHQKVVASLLDVPEEVCDLNPVKTCRFATKLVPHLSPTHQCTIVPKEVCVLKFSTPRQVSKPLISKWCLDTSDPAPGQSYEESDAIADPIGPNGSTESQPESTSNILPEEDLDTYSSHSQDNTQVDDIQESVSDYGPDTDTQLGSYGENLESIEAAESPDLGQEQTYSPSDEEMVQVKTNTSPTDQELQEELDTYGMENIEKDLEADDSYIIPTEPEESYLAPSPLEESNLIIPEAEEPYGITSQLEESYKIISEVEESYGSPSHVDESYGITSEVEESYISPTMAEESYEIISGVEESYGSPNQAEESYESPTQLEESYGIPTQVEESYGSPTQEEESYGSPFQVEESYVIPSKEEEFYEISSQEEESYGIPSPSYGSEESPAVVIAETYGSPLEEVGVSPVNSLYEIPSYEYEYDLDSYKSNEIPSYKIDSGFGEEPKFSYSEPPQSIPSPQISRHLAPPSRSAALTKHKANAGKPKKSKQNSNRIRSVDPYFYKI